ncbi:MAG: HEPN domain-containing protein [Candidatus Caldarchaeum sp.]
MVLWVEEHRGRAWWFEQAEAGLKTARDCLEDGNFYATAFSQQAAEKSLKGLLYSKGYRALITRSVTELGYTAEEFEEMVFRRSPFIQMVVETGRILYKTERGAGILEKAKQLLSQ